MLQEHRLARARRSEHGGDGVALEVEVETLEDLEVTEGLLDASHFNGVVVGAPFEVGRGGEDGGHEYVLQFPMGALGERPQNSWVPSRPMMWINTMLRIIERAVARPTPTGPPLAV